MNKEYICENGEVEVTDENGIKQSKDYSTNIEDVLIKENIIELIESKIIERENILINHQYDKDAQKILIPLPALMFGGVSMVIPSIKELLFNGKGFDYNSFANLPPSEITALALSPFMIGMGGFLSFDLYSKYKEISRKMKGNEKSLCFLRNQLEKEKEQLKNLKEKGETKNLCKEGFSTPKKINDESQLLRIKHLDNCYYSCGYKEKEYLKYLAKGTLKQILYKKGYSEDSIEFIEKEITNVRDEKKEKAKKLKKQSK